MPDFKPIVVPEKYKLPARGFLEALDKRLGGRQATAEFILEAGKPLAEAYLGVPLSRDTAKVILAAAIDAIYSDARPLPVEPPAPAPVVDSSDFAGVEKWLGKSRGTWPATVTISNVRVTGDTIRWDEAKGQREQRGWNVEGSGKRVNGEVNLIVPSARAAGTFDFLGVGQTVKTTGNLLFKSAGEPGMFAPWNPKKGERVGFYICTLNRKASQHKLSERSNVVWFTWP